MKSISRKYLAPGIIGVILLIWLPLSKFITEVMPTYNVLITIPLITLITCFFWPIHPLYASLAVIILHGLHQTLEHQYFEIWDWRTSDFLYAFLLFFGNAGIAALICWKRIKSKQYKISKATGIMRFIGKKSCSLGIHKWDKWIYISPSNCFQKAVCVRCKKEGQREQHNWGKWIFETTGSCVQTLTCSHCGITQSQIIHSWGMWTFTPSDSMNCRKERVCSRCGKIEATLTPHKWSYWQEYLGGDIRTCRNCGFQETHLNHDWGPWKEKKEFRIKSESPLEEALSGGDVRRCRRCRKEMILPTHDWEEWEAIFSEKTGVKCTRCKKKVTYQDYT